MPQYSLETIHKRQSPKVTPQYAGLGPELWLSLWLLLSAFEIEASPAKGTCGKEGFRLHPQQIVLQILYVLLVMLLLVAYFSDILLTCFLCEENK